MLPSSMLHGMPCPVCTLEKDLQTSDCADDDAAHFSGSSGVLLGLYFVWGVEYGHVDDEGALLQRLVDMYEARVLTPIRLLAGRACGKDPLTTTEEVALVEPYHATREEMRFHLIYHATYGKIGYATTRDVNRIISARRELPVT